MMKKRVLFVLGLALVAWVVVSSRAAGSASASVRAALEAALKQEDLGAVRKAVALAQEELGEQAGIPEEPDRYRPVPPGVALLTPEECAKAVTRSLQELEKLRFWKIGLDPAQMTAPLRAPASVVACMLALQRSGLVEGGQALEKAKEAADFLLWAQEQAGAGCYPFPAARGTSQARAMQVAGRFLERAEAAGRLGQIVRNGWVHDDVGDGGLQFDNGECGIAVLELYEVTQDRRYLESGLKAADWAASRPLCTNWNYNSFSVDLLAKAWQVAGRPEHLEAAVKKAVLGVIPGQLTGGPRAGRWLDAHNARPAYHYLMMGSLARLASVLPPEHPERAAVLASLRLGLAARNAEMTTLGVMSKDKPFECLALVTRLFGEDRAFLAETQSAEALDVLMRLASAEVRAGRLPLGPRAYGEMILSCARRP